MIELSAALIAKAALTLVLLALAGVCFVSRSVMQTAEPACWRLVPARRSAIGLAVAVILVTFAQFLIVTAQMFAVPVWPVDWGHAAAMAVEPSVGIPAVARIALAGSILLGAIALYRRPLAFGWLAALLSGLALATLAFSGHAAIIESNWRYLHLAADILHLLVAALWLGALIGFLSALHRIDCPEDTRWIANQLERFSTVGTGIVVLLIVTGSINLAMIVGSSALISVPTTAYGAVLGIKLALATVMLTCAGVNRWLLVPQLRASVDTTGTAQAASRLTASLTVETAALLALVYAVAVLGNMDPIS